MWVSSTSLTEPFRAKNARKYIIVIYFKSITQDKTSLKIVQLITAQPLIQEDVKKNCVLFDHVTD